MNKKFVITTLLALVAMAGQAKTFKTIKTPEMMAYVNVVNGELKAREVIFRDTATTVHFTMEYPKGQSFQFVSSSYLLDEDGNCYPLRSTEGIALNTWVQSPESGVTDFTMHFEPMPKEVQEFDYIGGKDSDAYKLLGIHDKKSKVVTPTFQELTTANPYTVPADWFKTDTITIQGRIEGYDAERFGFTSMECNFKDIFEKDAATLVLDIADDGTFYKRFKASYPIYQRFHTNEPKVNFNEIPFYACPGETIDITVKPNVQGQYMCHYNNGSSKDVERWLNSNLNFFEIAYPLHVFKGKVSEMGEMAERTWKNMLHRLQVKSQRSHFTPLEMQLAQADLQVNFVYAVLNYAEHHEAAIMTTEEHNGEYHQVVPDSAELEGLRKMENYMALHRVDFDNPLLLISMDCYFTLNRIQYAKPVMSAYFKQLDDYYALMREMLGSKDNTLVSQLCVYQKMLTEFKYWQTEKERVLEALKKLPDLSDSQKESALNSIPTIESKYMIFGNTFTYPSVKAKADEFFHRTMAQTELSAPLPDAPMADLICSFCAKYPGRILFIDFWDMSCGPCRGAIQGSKNLRAEIAKRDDVKVVFIAGERTTEDSDAYKKYVAKWLADEETICVTNADFTRLQELFRFNGLPHYETFTPDCRRVRDDLRISDYSKFYDELEQLKKKLK